ncbi:MAG: hypothetical protein GY942_17365, partial [Aestuariibacter sp.]|nr:hypothetical protein [Aestuariibacter sp.]
VTAAGKTPPPGHVPTNQDCNVCHQTSGFLPGSFDHSGITENCSACHGAGFATGKPEGHAATVQDCGVCHNTESFVGVVFDHTGIVDGCNSCHGVTATGKPGAHLPTDIDCHFCHTTAGFIGGTMDHQGITNGCVACHDGGFAPIYSLAHFVTTQDCFFCHTTTGWAPTSYTHSIAGDYPGDHAVNLGCLSCHQQNNETISYPYSTYASSCAGCHAGDYKASVDKHRSLSQDRQCSQCHEHSVQKREW